MPQRAVIIIIIIVVGVVVVVVVFESLQASHDALWRVQRDWWRVPMAEPSGPEQTVQVHHVIRVGMGDHDGVDPIGDGRLAVREQARKRAVAEVDDHPEPFVVDDEAAARSAGLGPAPTAAQDEKVAVHTGHPRTCPDRNPSTVPGWPAT